MQMQLAICKAHGYFRFGMGILSKCICIFWLESPAVSYRLARIASDVSKSLKSVRKREMKDNYPNCSELL